MDDDDECSVEIYEQPSPEDDGELYLNNVGMDQHQQPGPAGTDVGEDDVEYAAGQLYESDLMVKVQQPTETNVVAEDANAADKGNDDDELYVNDVKIQRQQAAVSNGPAAADDGQEDIDDDEDELYQNDVTIQQQPPTVSNGPAASTEDDQSDEGELYQNVITERCHDDDQREMEERYQNIGETGKTAEPQSSKDGEDEPLYQNVTRQTTTQTQSIC